MQRLGELLLLAVAACSGGPTICITPEAGCPDAPIPDVPSFTADVAYALLHCDRAGCHGNAGSDGYSVDFDQLGCDGVYAELLEEREENTSDGPRLAPAIDAGNPVDAFWYGKAIGGAAHEGGRSLNDGGEALLRRWIEQGSVNDCSSPGL